MATNTEDGGPAFPVEVYYDPEGDIQGRQTGPSTGWATGMSLRDWLAGQALPAIIAADGIQYVERSMWGHARLAYAQADAMLAARHHPEDDQ